MTIKSNYTQITLITFFNCQLIIIYYTTILTTRILQHLTLILQLPYNSLFLPFISLFHFSGIPLSLKCFSFIFTPAYFHRFYTLMLWLFFTLVKRLITFMHAFSAVIDAFGQRIVVFFHFIVRWWTRWFDVPYVHPMLGYLYIFMSLILNYLMTLFWLNVNRYFLLQIVTFERRVTRFNFQICFRILWVIRIHHGHVLNYTVSVGKGALLISVSRWDMSMVAGLDSAIIMRCFESWNLRICHAVISADGIALRTAVLVYHV